MHPYSPQWQDVSCQGAAGRVRAGANLQRPEGQQIAKVGRQGHGCQRGQAGQPRAFP